jgi:hypothetical protein
MASIPASNCSAAARSRGSSLSGSPSPAASASCSEAASERAYWRAAALTARTSGIWSAVRPTVTRRSGVAVVTSGA